MNLRSLLLKIIKKAKCILYKVLHHSWVEILLLVLILFLVFVSKKIMNVLVIVYASRQTFISQINSRHFFQTVPFGISNTNGKIVYYWKNKLGRLYEKSHQKSSWQDFVPHFYGLTLTIIIQSGYSIQFQ